MKTIFKKTSIRHALLAWLTTFLLCTGLTAQCPEVTAPSSNPPSSIVTVQVLSVKPNSDMEGDDDYVPFYDNRADIFGKVIIEGEEFSLPEVEDSDFPHWDITFEKQVTTSPVSIVIIMRENDSGLTGDNDDVDINPLPSETALKLQFDLCAMTIRSEGTQFPAQGVIEIKAGTGSSQATIRLKVGTSDGRPVTKNDLALIETDMIQVLFQTPKMITGKPTIVMARIANNYDVDVSTNVRVIVSGGGVNRNQVFPLSIGAGEVKKEYFFLDDPIRFPNASAFQQVALLVKVEDAKNEELDPKHCLRINDGNSQRLTWKTVSTPVRYDMLWAKVGTLLDGFNFTSDELLNENMELGGAYIHGVFPLAYPYNHTASVDIMPPVTAAVDFLTTILSPFGIPADNVIPYALVFELNGVANIVGCDRLMGVLPNKDWFERFSYDFLDDVTGLSLGEFAPRAVIFLPQYGKDENLAPAMTIAAHELGHTFGLSTDPTLKESWICDVDWPILGHSGCGFAGGFDEYKSETNSDGNPSNGFWIKQGGETNMIDTLLNMEQCSSFCFMGPSPPNAHARWESKKKWIDHADYDHLVNALQLKPDPEIIYVSGMISHDDQMLFGSIQHIGMGIPDRDTSYGAYVIRFVGPTGKPITEVGLPVNWNPSDISSHPRPVTFFGLNVVFPEGATELQVINRISEKVLDRRKISVNKPSIKLKLRSTTIAKGNDLPVAWKGRDRDGDKLQYFTMARKDKEEGWFPVETWTDKTELAMPTKSFQPGIYHIRVMASDGVHVTPSKEMMFTITE
jgi:hypothetical protein